MMQMGQLTQAAAMQFRRLNFNITRSMVDTVVSKHAVAQPRIEILTEGGSWEQQQRALSPGTVVLRKSTPARLAEQVLALLR